MTESGLCRLKLREDLFKEKSYNHPFRGSPGVIASVGSFCDHFVKATRSVTHPERAPNTAKLSQKQQKLPTMSSLFLITILKGFYVYLALLLGPIFDPKCQAKTNILYVNACFLSKIAKNELLIFYDHFYWILYMVGFHFWTHFWSQGERPKPIYYM